MNSDRGRSIGAGHYVAMYVQGDDEEVCGLIDWHNTPAGDECVGGSVMFDIPANAHVPDPRKWTVVSLDPLHLEPSLLCTACGDHGWIRDGAWVPA